MAAENGLAKAVAFDMGGTTAKLTLLDDLELQRSRQFEVARAYRFVQGSGLLVRIPVIELVEIGAGGGSIARIDALGRIQVGPTRPAACPAPRATAAAAPSHGHRCRYGAGPPRSQRAGGAIRFTATRPRRRCSRWPGSRPTPGAAAGVAEIVDETMASAARVHAVENGKDTAER